MKLAKYSNNLFPTMPSIFDSFFDGNLMDPMNTVWNNYFSKTNTTVPAVNVRETNDHFLIDVAVPGMKKDDFKVHYDNGHLTISSEHKEEKEEKNDEKLTRREFSYQSFQRSFTIAENTIDAENISAKYENGILHISLPKREEVKPKPAKRIEIK